MKQTHKSTKSKKSTKRSNQQSVLKRFEYKSGLSLIILGLIIAGWSVVSQLQHQHSAEKPVPASQVLNNNKPKDNGTPLIEGAPTHIALPSVNIDLDVIPGYYYPKTQTWTLSLNNAQYAVMTAKANNKEGDTFIYAHYRWKVFYNLPKVQTGAEAIVKTDNGHTFTYTFAGSTITTPDNTSLFNYQGKPILILQTCTGVHFENRQLFVFNLSKVS